MATSRRVLHPRQWWYQVEPYFISRISSYDDEIIFQAEPAVVCRDCKVETETPEEELNGAFESEVEESQIIHEDKVSEAEPAANKYATQVIDPRNIWITQSMMRDVMQYGTGRKAKSLKRADLAGKTGTTNDQRDAWFSGFNSSIVAVSWVGFDKFQPLGNSETGAKAALPMWIKYMEVALENVTEDNLNPPSGLLNIRINRLTGLPAKSDDPEAFFEIFREEFAPSTNKSSDDDDPYNPGEHESSPEELF